MGCGSSTLSKSSEPSQSSQSPPSLYFKVIMVGNSSTGKTSIINRYFDGYFNDSIPSTIGVDYRVKPIITKDGKKVKINIWDTAGQERFRSIINSYYRGVNIVIIVFDISEKFNVKQLDQWFDDIKRYCFTDPKIVLVGNKIDLPRMVDRNQVFEYISTKKDVKYIEVSAKTGEGINELFDIISSLI